MSVYLSSFIRLFGGPVFASQAVMTSTLLSSVTLVFIIYIARILFPIL